MTSIKNTKEKKGLPNVDEAAKDAERNVSASQTKNTIKMAHITPNNNSTLSKTAS